MKIKLPFLAIVLLTIFSCEELDKLTEFDITDNLGTTLEVSIPEGAPTNWSQEISVDLASNKQVQENLDYVQNVTINNLSFEITDYVGAADTQLTEASITVAGTSISIGTIDLKAADDANQVFSIGTEEQLAIIAAYLKQAESVTVTLSGIVSATPVEFNVVIDVDATITIDVI
ncbi:hypothetical protein RBH94_09415 [Aestuariibaculum sp. YM273]|uniref:hypothetical protein n=1 Tax=Aestuariibaculum sp. YM273 TaxID=3070659 RepID=UPI0027DBE46B|nr:hypothetical protein [Aestuariibaculum sp. YM273]WMI64280.1 hypothetical protein RBH94_09415 [Aestuariibaculum sp. YM273]